MKTSNKAIERAKLKVKEEADFEFCLENKVCPKCASDLEKETQAVCDVICLYFNKYSCTKCKFVHENVTCP